MVGKSFISSSGFRLAARAARPVVNTTEVRRKFRRLMPASGGAGFGFGLGAGGGMSVIRFGVNGGGQRGRAGGGAQWRCWGAGSGGAVRGWGRGGGGRGGKGGE